MASRRSRALAGALFLVLAALGGNASAQTPDKFGIVLMHGKRANPLGGTPGNTAGVTIGAGLVAALEQWGALVARPEMCWSGARNFDLSYTDCFRDIDAAIADLKGKGATRILVGGLSMGGNAALGYGATHQGLAGIIALGPSDDPQSLARHAEIAASIAQATLLTQQGKGGETASFNDWFSGLQGAYPLPIDTTPAIYLSFFGPQSPAGIPANSAKLTAPLLWVAGNDDPSQKGGAAYAFAKAPANKLNRYVEVFATYISTPDVAATDVLEWLDQVKAAPSP